MVLIVINGWFPAKNSAEAGKKYLEILKKFPRDKTLGKVIVPVGVKITKEGMKTFSVMEVKEGKFKEAMELSYNRLLAYSEIEGYTAEIEIYMSGTEALPLVGLQMPQE